MTMFGTWLIYHFFANNVILVVVGLVLLAGGFRFGWQEWQYTKIEQHPLLQLLMVNSRKIVWVYPMVTQRMPFGLQFSRNAYIYFKLLDGDELVLSLPEKKVEEVMKVINARLPHATFGFSKDKEQWYMADPGMLYRD